MKRHCLFTTAIMDFWDNEGDPLLLGPWCVAEEKNKKFLEGRAYDIVPSPWKPTVNMVETEEYCRRLYEKTLSGLSGNLNSIHYVSYPEKYWRVLLGPWLGHFVEVSYDRYMRIKKAIELFPDFYTYLPLDEDDAMASLDTGDFMSKLVASDSYNFALIGKAIRNLCPERVMTKKSELKQEIGGKHEENRRLNLLTYAVMRQQKFSDAPVALYDMHRLGRRDMVTLALKGNLKKFRFLYFDNAGDRVKENGFSGELRNRIALKGATDAFSAFLFEGLKNAVPMCYVENYGSYRTDVNRLRGLDSIKTVASAVGWYFDEEFKFAAAELASRGARLIDLQHGGGYGMWLVSLEERLSLEKDVFYTWGWDSITNKKIKRLPDPYLSGIDDTHSQDSDDLLFIGVTMSRYQYRFQTCLQPEDMAKYFEDKRTFFTNLPEAVKRNIAYRPYLANQDSNEIDRVKSMLPGVRLVLDRNITARMQKARLIVVDHPHTSFLEVLRMNAPCVLYWDHDVYLMRPDAEPYFRLLREAGILFKDPASAARKVAEIFEDPMKWWSDARVQKTRLGFCERYAYAKKGWPDVWAGEFQGDETHEYSFKK